MTIGLKIIKLEWIIEINSQPVWKVLMNVGWPWIDVGRGRFQEVLVPPASCGIFLLFLWQVEWSDVLLWSLSIWLFWWLLPCSDTLTWWVQKRVDLQKKMEIYGIWTNEGWQPQLDAWWAKPIFFMQLSPLLIFEQTDTAIFIVNNFIDILKSRCKYCTGEIWKEQVSIFWFGLIFYK